MHLTQVFPYTQNSLTIKRIIKGNTKRLKKKPLALVTNIALKDRLKNHTIIVKLITF